MEQGGYMEVLGGAFIEELDLQVLRVCAEGNEQPHPPAHTSHIMPAPHTHVALTTVVKFVHLGLLVQGSPWSHKHSMCCWLSTTCMQGGSVGMSTLLPRKPKCCKVV